MPRGQSRNVQHPERPSCRRARGRRLEMRHVLRRIASRISALVLMSVACTLPAQAHHSWARYDGENVITVTGTITSVEWASPHVVMHFTVASASGEPIAWTMEMDPPTLLNRYGLRHDVLMPGMRVKL